ncbi:hypothetical protein IW147_003877 [Coemansia sp. RSA 720]|nr:hypothetical protein IW147_003877 [Coemansia sp. RSA 720]
MKLFIKLLPPLPERKFIMACKQQTVKELRNEIKRRILAITTEAIIITLYGYELMDDDNVEDVIEPLAEICVSISLTHAAGSNTEKSVTPVKPQQPQKPQKPKDTVSKTVISKKEHGEATGKPGKKSKLYPAEIAYENSQPSGSHASTDEDGPEVHSLGRENWTQRANSITTEELDAMTEAEFASIKAMDFIAYKEIVIGADMTPSQSSYRVSQVLKVTNDTISVRVIRDLKPRQKMLAKKSAAQRRANLLGDDEQTLNAELEWENIYCLRIIS